MRTVPRCGDVVSRLIGLVRRFNREFTDAVEQQTRAFLIVGPHHNSAGPVT
jgi:hypothetical protein